jgi:hypothetical protein
MVALLAMVNGGRTLLDAYDGCYNGERGHLYSRQLDVL